MVTRSVTNWCDDDYDPILRSHCRLSKPDPAPPDATPDYWTRALDAYFKTGR